MELRKTDLPAIQVSGRQQIEIIDDAWDALLSQGDPPVLFVTQGLLSRMSRVEHRWIIDFVGEAGVNGLLVRAARWVQTRNGVDVAAKPPREIARDLLAYPNERLPELTAIATTPVFDAKGQLLNRSGYHADAALWMDLDEGWEACNVPEHPTQAELEDALALLLDELLGDFPLKADSDRAHVLAAIILPFIRRMFRGLTPIHLLEAPTPGTGKTRLADLICIVTVGDRVGTTTLSSDESEARKKFTTLLSAGTQVIFIDNVRGGIRSAELAAIITADMWTDRLLGVNKMVQCHNRALWLLSANNPRLSMEIARRCVRIRLVPSEEMPWKRTGFKHPDIVGWTREHRIQLVGAVLTIIQSWIAAGRPQGTEVLGSFEAWSRTVGGIINHCGLPGFLGDAGEFYADVDPESGEWAVFLTAWWEKHRDAPVSARALMQLAVERDLIAFARTGNSPSARDSKFGKSLSTLRDRKLSGLEVVFSKDSHDGARRYSLRLAASQSALEAKGSA